MVAILLNSDLHYEVVNQDRLLNCLTMIQCTINYCIFVYTQDGSVPKDALEELATLAENAMNVDFKECDVDAFCKLYDNLRLKSNVPLEVSHTQSSHTTHASKLKHSSTIHDEYQTQSANVWANVNMLWGID